MIITPHTFVTLITDSLFITASAFFLSAKKIGQYKENLLLLFLLLVLGRTLFIFFKVPEESGALLYLAQILLFCCLLLPGLLDRRFFAAALTAFLLFSLHYIIRFLCSLYFHWEMMSIFRTVIVSFNRYSKTAYSLFSIFSQVLILILLRKLDWIILFPEKTPLRSISLAMTFAVVSETVLFFGLGNMYASLRETLVFLSAIFLAIVITIAVFSLKISRLEKDALLRINEAERASYAQVIRNNTHLLQMRHEYQGHLRTMSEMSDPYLHNYLKDLMQKTEKTLSLSRTGDPYVDAVFNSKLPEIERNHIDFQQNIRLPGQIRISPSDLCAIISNQLDNAIEACAKIKENEPRWIRYSIDQKGQFVFLICRNSIQEPPDISKTSKTFDPELHGFGINNIRLCAERHRGNLVIEVLPDMFISKAMVQTEGV